MGINKILEDIKLSVVNVKATDKEEVVDEVAQKISASMDSAKAIVDLLNAKDEDDKPRELDEDEKLFLKANIDYFVDAFGDEEINKGLLSAMKKAVPKGVSVEAYLGNLLKAVSAKV